MVKAWRERFDYTLLGFLKLSVYNGGSHKPFIMLVNPRLSTKTVSNWRLYKVCSNFFQLLPKWESKLDTKCKQLKYSLLNGHLCALNTSNSHYTYSIYNKKRITLNLYYCLIVLKYIQFFLKITTCVGIYSISGRKMLKVSIVLQQLLHGNLINC